MVVYCVFLHVLEICFLTSISITKAQAFYNISCQTEEPTGRSISMIPTMTKSIVQSLLLAWSNSLETTIYWLHKCGFVLIQYPGCYFVCINPCNYSVLNIGLEPGIDQVFGLLNSQNRPGFQNHWEPAKNPKSQRCFNYRPDPVKFFKHLFPI